jgi:hypothetical protein
MAPTEPGDRYLDNTVMPPLPRRTANPASEPQRG